MEVDADRSGTYLLLLASRTPVRLSIGKLGEMTAVPGYYVYIGSAWGPGGVAARVRHHRKTAVNAHWHIDYLRAVTAVTDVYCVYGSRCEHEWAHSLMQSAGATMPLRGFGSSDCDCATHLFYFGRKPLKTELEKLLTSKLESLDSNS
jgi:Uri superfamily endonuclease